MPEPQEPAQPSTDRERTVSELIDEPRQQDVPDEARTLRGKADEHAFDEVLDQAESERATMASPERPGLSI